MNFEVVCNFVYCTLDIKYTVRTMKWLSTCHHRAQAGAVTSLPVCILSSLELEEILILGMEMTINMEGRTEGQGQCMGASFIGSDCL